MINAELSHCKTLPEWYKSIREQHEEAHGHEYCHQHDAMQKLMANCDSYRELGTHQGASLAAACLTNPKSVTAVDIDLHRWRPFESIFRTYCDENDIVFNALEMSSHDTKSVGPTDLLLIDSLHNARHLLRELNLHLPYIRKYVVLHDTSVLHGRPNDSLFKVVEEWCARINPWEIKERNTTNVGYTVMENTLNV